MARRYPAAHPCRAEVIEAAATLDAAGAAMAHLVDEDGIGR
jgi:hypothetical protein